MPVPTLTNHETVVRCVANLIENLTVSNGWYFDGVMVDFDRDPRHVQKDRIAEYRDKRNLVIIKHGGGERERADDAASRKVGSRSIGGVHRRKYRMELWSLQTLSKDESSRGITLSTLAERMRYSIEWGLDKDFRLEAAAARLGIPPPTSCINLQLEDILSDEVIRFPDVHQILVVTYLADEYRPQI